MNKINQKQLLLLLLILCVALLPWLGFSLFHTKGEPREAIVSLTMLEQNNWILPHNNGGEMAYKPPFFHWCIACAATLFGGMSEWVARFPSALACILMLVWTFVFYARRVNAQVAWCTTLVCLSCFEIFRAANACRVDMMLTFCIVGALFAFFRWTEEKPRRSIPFLPILMMSMGTLTKGPVAIVLPCGIIGLYLLLRRENFLRTLMVLSLTALASLILPAIWYWFAYQQGGEEFLALVKEENIDRFLGKMSYNSHENGLWYYFVLLPTGLLPWSLVLFPTLFKGIKNCVSGSSLTTIRQWFSSLTTVELFTLLATVLIFVFYCIPKSKRGVYIMPMYPFMAYWIASYLVKKVAPRTLRLFYSLSIGLFTLAFAYVLPFHFLNKKSDRDIAYQIKEKVGDAYLTSYISGYVVGNPMHYFTINYYLEDKVDLWKSQGPASSTGYLLIGERDAESFIQSHPEYSFQPIELENHRSCDTKQTVLLYSFAPASL